MNSVMSCETHCCCVKYKELEFDKFSGLIVQYILGFNVYVIYVLVESHS